MSEAIMKVLSRIGIGLMVVIALLISSAGSALAGGGDLLLSRKFHGILLLGTSGFLIKKAVDAKSEANDAYDFYKLAGLSTTARDFYDDSKRHDTRAAVLGILGGATLLYSLHLFTKDDDELPMPRMDRGIVNVKGVVLDVKGDMFQKKMQVQLEKGF
jgi:hypothetical protein